MSDFGGEGCQTLNSEPRLGTLGMRAVPGTEVRAISRVHLILMPENWGIKAPLRLA